VLTLALLPAAAHGQAPELEEIFFDGFETGTTSRWYDVSLPPFIRASLAAAMSGLYGLEASVDGARSVYVQDDSATPDVSIRNRDASYYHVSFRFDPNGFDPGEASGRFRTRIFIAFQEDPQRRLFALVLRRRQGQFALMGRVRQDDGIEVDTGFHDISDEPHLVEMVWHRSGATAANGMFRLAIDGSPIATLEGLDNHASGVDFTRLGALSVKPGANGILFWDDFRSGRDLMAARTQLIFNEVDYEQPGVDAQEFVEVYNRGPAEVELNGNGFMRLIQIDGATHEIVLTVPAPFATLSPGQYLVFATSGVTVAPAAVRTGLFFEQENIGNGAPDGLVLVHFDFDVNCTVLDVLAYEGPMSAPLDFFRCGLVDFVRGTPLPADIEDSDSFAGSLIRLPNGSNTGDHATDWTFTTTPTPGAANVHTP
jgi:hypothetical protein